MLRQRALAATATSGVEIVIRQGLQILAAVVLARLLTPEDFGTMALLALFLGVASAVSDGGLSAAVIRARDLTEADKSTAFWLNVLAGAFFTGLLSICAPVIAEAFSTPALQPLLVVMALNVLIVSLGGTQTALLIRELRFRTILISGAVAALVSGVTAILLAWRGLGIWALAAQTLVMSTVSVGLIWVLSRWRPSTVPNRVSARRLLAFGGYVLGASLLDMIYSRSYALLIGKLHGIQAVGFYNRADTTQQIPADLSSAVLNRVTLPIFASFQDDPSRLRDGVRTSIRGTMLISAPVMLTLGALANPVVVGVFGEPWAPAGPLLQILCLSGLLWPLHTININFMLAAGKSRLVFWLDVLKKPLGLGLLFGGAFFGLEGIAWGQVIFGVFAFIMNAFCTKRLIGYGVLEQLQDFAAPIGVAAPLALVLYLASAAWAAQPLLEAVALGMLGLVSFGALVLALRLPIAWEMKAILRRPKVEEPAT